MKLTNTQIIESIFAATLGQLPGRALLRSRAGVTLFPDEWHSMKKAISHMSTDRTEILPNISSEQSRYRLHNLERKGLLVADRAGNAFTFWLPEEHLGQCWFRTRELLKIAGIPDYACRPVQINTTALESTVHQQLLSEFHIRLNREYDRDQLNVVSGRPYISPLSVSPQ